MLEFLEYGFVTDERAIYGNVRKLPPATVLEWHDGTVTERCYWSLPKPDNTSISFENAVEQTESLLIEAVRLRLETQAQSDGTSDEIDYTEELREILGAVGDFFGLPLKSSDQFTLAWPSDPNCKSPR